jgi:hypothetical protein
MNVVVFKNDVKARVLGLEVFVMLAKRHAGRRDAIAGAA